MIIEIPDERLVAWFGCHPETPVKEAIEIFLNCNKVDNYHVFTYIGEYVIKNAIKY